MTKNKNVKKPAEQQRAEFVALMAQELRHIHGGLAAGGDKCDALLCW